MVTRCCGGLAGMEESLNALSEALDRVLDDYRHLLLGDLQASLLRLRDALPELPDYLHCLSALKEPASVNPEGRSASAITDASPGGRRRRANAAGRVPA